MFEQFWHGTLRRPYRLHTTSHGELDKPVVVLLHGIAASGESWGKLIPLLTPQYRCITIDLLGFGKSPKPQWAEYGIEQHVGSIRHTLRSLHIHGQYTLVGHSLGSLLATNYARRYPGKIGRLLLLSPPVYPPLNTIQGRLALRRTDLLMRVYRIIREHPRMKPENIARLSKIHVIPRTIVIHPDTWIPFKRSLQRCIEQQTIVRDIQDIRMPVDAFYGVLDSVVIGANVRGLALVRDMSIHTFRGNHKFGQLYAQNVAKLLLL